MFAKYSDVASASFSRLLLLPGEYVFLITFLESAFGHLESAPVIEHVCQIVRNTTRKRDLVPIMRSNLKWRQLGEEKGEQKDARPRPIPKRHQLGWL